METCNRNFVTLQSLQQLIKDNSDSELNKDGLLTDTIMRLLDIPLYNKDTFTKFVYLTTEGTIIYCIKLIKGVWKDYTEIERLQGALKKSTKELIELQQEVELK